MKRIVVLVAMMRLASYRGVLADNIETNDIPAIAPAITNSLQVAARSELSKPLFKFKALKRQTMEVKAEDGESGTPAVTKDVTTIAHTFEWKNVVGTAGILIFEGEPEAIVGFDKLVHLAPIELREVVGLGDEAYCSPTNPETPGSLFFRRGKAVVQIYGVKMGALPDVARCVEKALNDAEKRVADSKEHRGPSK